MVNATLPEATTLHIQHVYTAGRPYTERAAVYYLF